MTSEQDSTRAPAADHLLTLTGERTVPRVPSENYWFRRHEAAYLAVRPLMSGRVVEIGCGEGYGTALLSEAVARPVLGLDYDAASVAHAATIYPAARFARANLAALPVGTGAVDTVVSLQVIEHVWDHAQFLAECHRVLRPDGRLIVSTPNRLTFSPGRDKPRNAFHTHEFVAAELTGALTACGFAVRTVLGLHAGPPLHTLDVRYGGSFPDAQLASPPPEWPPGLADDVAAVTTEDFPIVGTNDADIDHSLDLIVIARPLSGT